MYDLISPSTTYIAWVLTLVVIICRLFLKDACNILLSKLLDRYLTWRFSIKSKDGQNNLPSLPFCWPDGAGDAGKWTNGKTHGEKWQIAYGDVYRIWSGMTSEIVVSKPEHVQAIFHDSHLHFKALNNDSGYFFGEILGRCVGLLSGKEWKWLRQEIDVAFNHKAIVETRTSISKATNNFIDDLLSSNACQNGVLDPANDMMYYFFFTTAELIYGPLSSHQKTQLKEISVVRNKLFTYVLEGGIHRFSASKWLPSKANRDLAVFQTRWREWNKEMYELNQKTARVTSFGEWWRRSLDGEIDMVQLLQTLDESLFANLDVTTGAISWVLLFLAAYPEEQDTLLNEASKSLLEGEQTWADYITRNDTFLAACLNEAARLRPGLPFSIPQAAPTSRNVGKWVIPAKTMFIVDTYALNVHNSFWGDDRTTFRPSRFLDLGSSQIRYNFFRFGFGPRQCMGKHLADRMLRSLVASLICKLKLELRPEDGARMEFSSNPDVWVTQTNLNLKCVQRDCKAIK